MPRDGRDLRHRQAGDRHEDDRGPPQIAPLQGGQAGIASRFIVSVDPGPLVGQ
jgi:hypothetical protein